MRGIGQASAEGSRPLPTNGVHGCFVGNGLDRSVGCRKRCAHPLAPSVRGLRPQAVGERTVRLPEIFWAMARFSRSVSIRWGNGLDRSGDVCRCCMVKYCCGVGAAYMRPGSVRQTGAYGKPAGRACPAPTARRTKKRTPTQPSRRGSAAESLALTPSPQTPLLPPLRRSPPFPPYRRC